MLSEASKEIISQISPDKSSKAPLVSQFLKVFKKNYKTLQELPLNERSERLTKPLKILDDGISCPEIVRESKHAKYEMVYTTTIFEKELTVRFFTMTKRDCTDYAKRVVFLMLLLLPFSPARCTNNLAVNIVFCKTKKMMPSRGDSFGRQHLNSGYSYRCVPDTSITVYREEEWFKVLVHESFHYFGFDEALDTKQNNDRVRNMFLVDSEINLPEAYCETWARVLNVYLTAFWISPNNFSDCVALFMELEKYFSWFQMTKMLKSMGLSYADLKRPNHFKEETNMFAYIVLTNDWMQRYDEFMLWCATKNPNLFLSGPDACVHLFRPKKRAFERPLPVGPSKHLTNNSRMTVVELV